MEDKERLTERGKVYADLFVRRLQELENGIDDYQVLILPDDMPCGGTAAEHAALFWKRSWDRYKKLYSELVSDFEKLNKKYCSADSERVKAILRLATAEELIDRFNLTAEYRTELKKVEAANYTSAKSHAGQTQTVAGGDK